MKKLITILSIAILSLTSCDNREFKLIVTNGSGLSYTETWLYCDSVQMISTTEADVWIDGKKMKIYADRGIRIEN